MRKFFAIFAFSTLAMASTNDLLNLLNPGVPIRIWNAHYLNDGVANTTNQEQYLVTINDTIPVGLDIPVRNKPTSPGYDLGLYFSRQQIVDSAQLKQYALLGRIIVSNEGFFVPAAIFSSGSATGSVSDASAAEYGNSTASTNMVLASGAYATYSWSGSTKEINVFNLSTNAVNTNLYVYVGNPKVLIGKSIAPDSTFVLNKLEVNEISISSCCANTACQIFIIKR